MTTIDPIEDLDDPTFDPLLADEIMFGDMEDPYSRLAELRRQAPVVEGDFRVAMGVPTSTVDNYAPHWMVLSFDAVDQVLNHPEQFSNRSFLPTLGAAFGQTVSVMDPPEHTKYRKILQKAFRPNAVDSWGADIVGPVIEDLMTKIRGRGQAELVSDFARPYPFEVIYRMLDLPPEDIDVFFKLTVTQLFTSVAMDKALEASAKLGRYFKPMIERRREYPGADLVSVIATTQIDGEYLPEEVAVSFLRQLINAGGDTTFRTTTALLTGLLTNPDQLQAVRADRSLVAPAVEEGLRWNGPVVAASRETTEATTVAGVPVPAGAYLDLCYGSANHDENAFPDPERFDIFRPKHRHFGFAFGVHNCLGQVLARLEMSRALNAILDQLPNVRLDPESPPPQLRGYMMRTPRALNVIFDS
jgi:cytochrome P450